jgi:hypothetical protein
MRPLHELPRTARALTAALVGGAVGATIAFSAAAALGSSTAAGYGGTAGALQVTVSGDTVRVVGSGFLASSAVDVVVGDLHATVTADDVGAVDAVLHGSAAASAVAATGVDPSGATTTARPVIGATSGTEGPTLFGASLGAAPSFLAVRRRRSVKG